MSNLADLARSIRDTAKMRTCSIKAGHNDSLGSVSVDLIGLYTLHGKDGSSIDPMCLTMIDPATS